MGILFDCPFASRKKSLLLRLINTKGFRNLKLLITKSHSSQFSRMSHYGTGSSFLERNSKKNSFKKDQNKKKITLSPLQSDVRTAVSGCSFHPFLKDETDKQQTSVLNALANYKAATVCVGGGGCGSKEAGESALGQGEFVLRVDDV